MTKTKRILWEGGCIQCGHWENLHTIVIKSRKNVYLCQYTIRGRQISPRRWKLKFTCKCQRYVFRELIIKGFQL